MKFEYSRHLPVETFRSRGLVTKIASADTASQSVSTTSTSQSSPTFASQSSTAVSQSSLSDSLVSHQPRSTEPSDQSNNRSNNQRNAKRQRPEQSPPHHTSKRTAVDLGHWQCLECVRVNPADKVAMTWSTQCIRGAGSAPMLLHFVLYHSESAVLLMSALNPDRFQSIENALHNSRTTLTNMPAAIQSTQSMNDGNSSSTSSVVSNTSIQPTDDELMSRIVTFFATNAIARSKLKHEAFIDFLRTFIPDFQAEKLTQTKFLVELERQANEARATLIETLRTIRNLVITLGFDSMTCHGHKYVNIMLLSVGRSDYWTTIDCGQEADTTENEVKLLAKVIDDLRTNYELEVHGIVCDNTNNVVAAARRLAKSHDLIQLGCAAHQVQLIVRKMLEDEELNCELHVFDEMINGFRNGKGSKKRRNDLAQLTQLKIIVPNVTRWNGIHRSYVRLQDLRQHIIELGYDRDAEVRDWQTLDAVVGILGFFKEITDKVQSDSNTLFVTYQCFRDIKERLIHLESVKSKFTSPGLQQFSFNGSMLEAVNKWSEETSSSQAIQAMQFLDVSTHYRPNRSVNTRAQDAKESESRDATIEWIKETGSRILARSSWFPETVKKKISSKLHNQCHCLIQGMMNGFAFGSEEQIAIAEHRRVDVFQYWSLRETRDGTKELASFASILIRLIATEASVERSFSDHKQVQNNLRNRLDIVHIVQEMMIRWNHRLNVAGRSNKDNKLETAMAELDIFELEIESVAPLSMHSLDAEELE